MLKIGIIFFAIGLLLISPIDDIIILIPLSAFVGLWIFPLFVIIALIFLIIGAILIGKHILPLLANPITALFIIIAVLIGIYCIISSGWITL